MFSSIANTFSNCFKIPELKSRIILALAEYFKTHQATGASVLGMYSLFTGGAMENCAIGALGIMPYISATIIIQLLTAVVPTLSKLAREEGGRTQIIKYGRYLTVLLCLGQGLFMAIGWENPESIFNGWNAGRLVLYSDSHIWWYRIQTLLIL